MSTSCVLRVNVNTILFVLLKPDRITLEGENKGSFENRSDVKNTLEEKAFRAVLFCKFS